ncbi:hypothetical protein E2C01_076993 [Portunus trituberculatus]|uniref:Uncharacterized protein n=1 Tax=Portunus trituberculatus TaxID=210409 RepID=A0A5B7IQ43_PORTR|nr:hypothetical protein [Portunus trituberculatus]
MLLSHQQCASHHSFPALPSGLWEVCFTNYHDYTYRYDRIYDGCYWTLDEEMHVISDQLKRREFYGTCISHATFSHSLIYSILLIVI